VIVADVTVAEVTGEFKLNAPNPTKYSNLGNTLHHTSPSMFLFIAQFLLYLLTDKPWKNLVTIATLPRQLITQCYYISDSR